GHHAVVRVGTFLGGGRTRHTQAILAVVEPADGLALVDHHALVDRALDHPAGDLERDVDLRHLDDAGATDGGGIALVRGPPTAADEEDGGHRDDPDDGGYGTRHAPMRSRCDGDARGPVTRQCIYRAWARLSKTRRQFVFRLRRGGRGADRLKERHARLSLPGDVSARS